MSVIAIVVERGTVSPITLIKLYRVLGVSLQTLKSTLQACEPIMALELFEGDYQANATSIRSVMAALEAEDIIVSYYEMPCGEPCAGNPNLALWKIDSQVVSNILCTADDELERQVEG
ncbi:hypothetical protein [Pseudomonas entomophila]|uniref:hypothetical protein n=1 Tax=Pseudomonas entomophila TaxID=312306 RepID=UPI003EB7A8F4